MANFFDALLAAGTGFVNAGGIENVGGAIARRRANQALQQAFGTPLLGGGMTPGATPGINPLGQQPLLGGGVGQGTSLGDTGTGQLLGQQATQQTQQPFLSQLRDRSRARQLRLTQQALRIASIPGGRPYAQQLLSSVPQIAQNVQGLTNQASSIVNRAALINEQQGEERARQFISASLQNPQIPDDIKVMLPNVQAPNFGATLSSLQSALDTTGDLSKNILKQQFSDVEVQPFGSQDILTQGSRVRGAAPAQRLLLEEQQTRGRLKTIQAGSNSKIRELEAKSELSLSEPPKRTDISSLRNKFIELSKDFRDIRQGVNRIESIKPSAAGDISMIFSYMKILDPTSVVREGEQATAQNARGVDLTTRTIWNKLITGETLTPKQRQDFRNQARNILKGAQKAQDKNESEFRRIARLSGIPEDQVIVDFSTSAPQTEEVPDLTEQSESIGSGRNRREIFNPQTQQEFEALPSGSFFRDPDEPGKTFRKP